MTFCFKGRFRSRTHCYNARLRDKRLRWISEESTIEESDSRCFGRAKSGTRAENERKGEWREGKGRFPPKIVNVQFA